MRVFHRDSKILNISHYDLDGVGCQILISHVHRDVTFKQCGYGKVDQIVREINPDNWDGIYMTDITPSPELWDEIKQWNNLVIIDHHGSALPLNSPAEGRFLSDHACATQQVYDYLRWAHGKEIFSHLPSMEQFVWHINDYDTYKLEDSKSLGFNFLYWRNNHNYFRKAFNDGRVSLSRTEQDFVDQSFLDIDNAYANLSYAETDICNGIVIQIGTNMNEIMDKVLKAGKYNIVFNIKDDTRLISIRHNNPRIDIGNVLKRLGFGGGHAKTGGCTLTGDMNYRDTILTIESEIFNTIISSEEPSSGVQRNLLRETKE